MPIFETLTAAEIRRLTMPRRKWRGYLIACGCPDSEMEVEFGGDAVPEQMICGLCGQRWEVLGERQ